MYGVTAFKHRFLRFVASFTNRKWHMTQNSNINPSFQLGGNSYGHIRFQHYRYYQKLCSPHKKSEIRGYAGRSNNHLQCRINSLSSNALLVSPSTFQRRHRNNGFRTWARRFDLSASVRKKRDVIHACFLLCPQEERCNTINFLS